jgi:5-methylcytosine-specific restriction endonuclease McrA
MKRTELKRNTPLNRGQSKLARVAKRKLPAFRKAAKWRQQYLDEHGVCQINLSRGRSGWVVLSLDEFVELARWIELRPCGYYSVDVHEIVKRGRGGSTAQDENVLAVCRNCHDFTEAHPRLATKLGLLASKRRDG